MTNKVTLEISLPINGTSFDRAAAICEAISAATMRGDSFCAIALGQLYADLQPMRIGSAAIRDFELKDCVFEDGPVTLVEALAKATPSQRS